MTPDGELLRRYLDGSEAAFAELVRRHINLVYRAAIRRVGGNAHAADDVTQKVFIALAQKPPRVWVSYVPLAPLAVLFFTGMYLFVLPYAVKWRGARSTD